MRREEKRKTSLKDRIISSFSTVKNITNLDVREESRGV